MSNINENKIKLFSLTKKDFIVTWYKSGGPGGQKKNKTANACRIKHIESGAISTGQSHRSRIQNQKDAFYGLLKKPKFIIWKNKKIAEFDEKQTIEQWVDEQMVPENIITEIRINDKWEKVDNEGMLSI